MAEWLQASFDWLRANWELPCVVCALAVIHAAEAWALLKLAKATADDPVGREKELRPKPDGEYPCRRAVMRRKA